MVVSIIIGCSSAYFETSVEFQITKLLLRSFLPLKADSDEVIRRILRMGELCPEGAYMFHHLVITKKLITVEQAG